MNSSGWSSLSQENTSPLLPDIWSHQGCQTEGDLPPGWKRITDKADIYYWHIPSGATQWERPAPRDPLTRQEGSSLGDTTSASPPPDHQKQLWGDVGAVSGGKIDSEVWKDPSPTGRGGV
uniref:WW domain-containing protein n=1 Tax=Oncorhynchus tshawytscha TaxID=74940 RepID=A0AAZ3PLV5_ONCTS